MLSVFFVPLKLCGINFSPYCWMVQWAQQTDKTGKPSEKFTFPSNSWLSYPYIPTRVTINVTIKRLKANAFLATTMNSKHCNVHICRNPSQKVKFTNSRRDILDRQIWWKAHSTIILFIDMINHLKFQSMYLLNEAWILKQCQCQLFSSLNVSANRARDIKIYFPISPINGSA